MPKQAKIDREAVKKAFGLAAHEMEYFETLLNLLEDYLRKAQVGNPRFDLFVKVWNEYKFLTNMSIDNQRATEEAFGKDDEVTHLTAIDCVRDYFITTGIIMQLGDLQWKRGIPTPGWFQGMGDKGYSQLQRESFEKFREQLAAMSSPGTEVGES